MSAERIKVLRQQIAKVDLAIDNLQTAKENIGLEGFPNHPSFDLTRADLSPEQFIAMAERVGDIRQKIENTSIPKLERQKEELRRGVIITFAESLQRIEVHVTEGRLPQSVLEEAERRFALISEKEAKAPLVTVEETPAVETPKKKAPKPAVEGAGISKEEIEEKVKMSVNLETHIVNIGDREVVIAEPHNWAVFKYLYEHKGKEITNQALQTAIMEATGDWRQIRSMIKDLQKLLEPVPGEDRVIKKSGSNRIRKYMLDVEVEKEEEEKPAAAKGGKELVEVSLPDGKRIKVGKKLGGLMNILAAASKDEKLTRDELGKRIYADWSEKRRPSLYQLLGEARKRFDFHGWRLIQHYPTDLRRRSAVGSYYIEKVNGDGVEKKEWPVAPHQTRLDALAEFCDLQGKMTLDEMRRILGPDKKGKPLSAPAIRIAVENTMNRLMVRTVKGFSKKHIVELQTLEAVEARMTALGFDKKEWKRFRAEWLVEKLKGLKPSKSAPEPEATPVEETGTLVPQTYQEQVVSGAVELVGAEARTQTVEEVPVLVRFSAYEAFLLAALLKNNPEIIQKHQLNFVDDETILRLAPEHDYFKSIPPKVIKEELEGAIDKLKVLAEGNEAGIGDLDPDVLAVVGIVAVLGPKAKDRDAVIADLADAASKFKKEPFVKLTEKDGDKGKGKQGEGGRVFSIEKSDPKAREKVQSLITRVKTAGIGDKATQSKMWEKYLRGLRQILCVITLEGK